MIGAYLFNKNRPVASVFFWFQKKLTSSRNVLAHSYTSIATGNVRIRETGMRWKSNAGLTCNGEDDVV